jgi:hypothetical protein
MTEKTVNEIQSAAKKERFEFVLTINGNIVCQRYFRINGFRNDSLRSLELVDAIDRCVTIIDNDLKAKSLIYLQCAAPQVFDTVEEMEKWVNHPRTRQFDIEVPSYVVVKETDETFVWGGKEMEKYDKYFNTADFLQPSEGECVLKFAFLDNGREVCAKTWNGGVYPRFIRTNIDLSNSRNKYEGGDTFAPFESAIIKLFNESRTDLIPVIVKEICNCCSSKDGYTTSDDYKTVVNGEVVETRNYNFDIWGQNYKYFRNLERAYRKKTDDYFKRY